MRPPRTHFEAVSTPKIGIVSGRSNMPTTRVVRATRTFLIIAIVYVVIFFASLFALQATNTAEIHGPAAAEGFLLRLQKSGTMFERMEINATKNSKQQDPTPTLALNKIIRMVKGQVAEQLEIDEKNIKPCRQYHQTTNGDKIRAVIDPNCQNLLDQTTTAVQNKDDNEKRKLAAFNPLGQERWFCGVAIPPKTAVLVQNICSEPHRLFPKDPPIQYNQEEKDSDINTGNDMPPIFISVNNHDKQFKNFQCDVPCQVAGQAGLNQLRKIKDTDWSFTFSMEGPHYYKNLIINPEDYKADNYFATTSFQSEVPLPYFSWAEYKIQEPAIDFDNAIKGASFIARNCGSKNDREGVVKKLIASSFRVDSLSSCLKNAEPPNGLGLKNKIKLQQQYLFHLAFENGCEDDYITEKLWGSFESGTLPVYFGAPNVHEHAPENSIIIVQDFESIDALGAYLNKVANNKTLYNSYHSWRSKDLPETFHQKYDFTHIHSNCRMCRWAHAKKYGLGWNHNQQRIEELAIPRTLVLDAKGAVASPFQEIWIETASGQGTAPLPISPTVGSNERTVVFNMHPISRTVWEHDGFIDLHIEQSNDQWNINHLIFQLKTEVLSNELIQSKVGNVFILYLQDARSRFTLLTSWDAKTSSPEMGTINISLDHGSFSWFANRRMRVIVEDIDKLHQGEGKTNYFGQMGADDFFSQIEMFTVNNI